MLVKGELGKTVRRHVHQVEMRSQGKGTRCSLVVERMDEMQRAWLRLSLEAKGLTRQAGSAPPVRTPREEWMPAGTRKDTEMQGGKSPGALGWS